MSEERKQSPHYIPELDPEHPNWPKPVSGWIIWSVFLVGLALLAGAGAAWFSGETWLAILLGVVALVIFIVF